MQLRNSDLGEESGAILTRSATTKFRLKRVCDNFNNVFLIADLDPGTHTILCNLPMKNSYHEVMGIVDSFQSSRLKKKNTILRNQKDYDFE